MPSYLSNSLPHSWPADPFFSLPSTCCVDCTMDQLRADVEDGDTESEPDSQAYFFSQERQQHEFQQQQQQQHAHSNPDPETDHKNTSQQYQDSGFEMMRQDPSDMPFFGDSTPASSEQTKTPFLLGAHGEAPRWAPSTSTLSLSESLSDPLSDALSENYIEAQNRLSSASSQHWGSTATGLSLSSSTSMQGFDMEEAEKRLSFMSVQRWEPNASNLSLTDVLMDMNTEIGTGPSKVDAVGQRLSNISVHDLSQDARRESQMSAAELRRESDLWKKYPLPGTGTVPGTATATATATETATATATATGMDTSVDKDTKDPKDTDMWKQLTATYLQPFYICELAQTSKWSERYQRNNRNGGLKNIRCFPCCGREHFARGFCGESVTLLLQTNQPAENIVAVAEFGLALEAQETKVKVGALVSQKDLQGKIKTNSSESLFNPWWLGEVTDSRITSMSGHRSLAFEFNASKRGWNYGWVANKHNNQLKHCLRAYLFVPSPQNEGQLVCVGIAKSPDFLLFTRKSKLPPSLTTRKPSASGEDNQTGEAASGPLSELLEAMRILRLFDALHKLPSDVLNEEFANLFKSKSEKEEVEGRFENFGRYCLGQNETISSSIITIMENLCKLPNQGLSKQEVMIRFLSSFKGVLEDAMKKFGLTFTNLASSKVGVNLSDPLTAKEKMGYLALAERFMHYQFGYDAEWLQDNYISRVKPLKKNIQGLEGHWIRGSASLFHYERMLSIMGVPVSIRMCWVFSRSAMTVRHCADSETLIVGFRNKLLNTGVVRLMYDGKPHLWTQIPSLGDDSIFAGDSYVAWYDVDTHTFNVERILQQHKLVWSLQRRHPNSLQGKCVLYEKVLVSKDTTWAMVCKFEDVLERLS